MAPLALALPATALTCVAAYCDQRTGLIPNRVTLGGLAGALLVNSAFALHDRGPSAIVPAIVIALAGALVTSLGPLFLFRTGALGGGDVKLFAALGALLGPQLGLRAELLGFVCAAVLALFHLARRGELVASFRRLLVHPRAAFPATPELGLRVGPAIFAGTLWALSSGPGA